MTEMQIKRAKALASVNFGTNKNSKEFARGMAFQSERYPDRELTERQSNWLNVLCWTHRAAIPAELAPTKQELP